MPAWSVTTCPSSGTSRAAWTKARPRTRRHGNSRAGSSVPSMQTPWRMLGGTSTRSLVIGLTERFEETFVLLRRKLGLRRPLYITRNVSRAAGRLRASRGTHPRAERPRSRPLRSRSRSLRPADRRTAQVVRCGSEDVPSDEAFVSRRRKGRQLAASGEQEHPGVIAAARCSPLSRRTSRCEPRCRIGWRTVPDPEAGPTSADARIICSAAGTAAVLDLRPHPQGRGANP